MNKYVKQYKWSKIFTMLKNQKKDPAICTERFENRLVIITGATSGIGYKTARKYASQGSDILSVNRSKEKSEALCDMLKTDYSVNCTYMLADFTKLSDIHKVGKELAALERDIDVFIHNAGTYVTQKTITEDGLEQVFQTNYLSTFILNHYIKSKLIQQNKGRIIFVNSEAHRFAAWGLRLNDLLWDKRSYSGLKSYGAAKLEQLLSMLKLNQDFANTNVTINAMHPGNIKTNSGTNNGKLYKFYKRNFIDRNARPVEIASEALYYLGVSKDVKDISGKFFNLTTEEEPAPPALDLEEAEKLWEVSLELGGIHGE